MTCVPSSLYDEILTSVHGRPFRSNALISFAVFCAMTSIMRLWQRCCSIKLNNNSTLSISVLSEVSKVGRCFAAWGSAAMRDRDSEYVLQKDRRKIATCQANAVSPAWFCLFPCLLPVASACLSASVRWNDCDSGFQEKKQLNPCV